MLHSLAARLALIAVLLTITITAGVIGGIDFEPDVAIFRGFAALRAAGSGVTMSAIAITKAGSAFGTVGVGPVVAPWLVTRRDRALGALLAATVAVERLVIAGLQLIIDRTRPSFDLHPVATHSSSFPSGHAGNSMAVFLAIALIAVPRRHR